MTYRNGAIACAVTVVQSEKKSLSVAIIGEFYISDLMEIPVKNVPQN